MAAFTWCLGIGLVYVFLASIMTPGSLVAFAQRKQYLDITKHFAFGALAYGMIFFVGYQVGTGASVLFG